MALVALRQALLDYALSPHMRLLEDRYNALTLSVLNEAFPPPSYAVTTQDPLNAVRGLRDPDYGDSAPGSSTLVAGPSSHHRSLSGSYYESDSGFPFDFPAGERQRISLESVNSVGVSLAPDSLKKPDFTVLSFDGWRVEPRVVVELKTYAGADDPEALDQILEQVKAVVALTGVKPGAFLVRGTTWRRVELPRVVDNNTRTLQPGLSGVSFDSLDPNAAEVLRRSCSRLPP